MNRLSSILIAFLLAGIAYGQPVAKIVGPATAPPGELVVLSSQGSSGDNLVWVKPDTIQTVQAGCTILDTQVFFSTTKLGKYEFMLIAADKEARVSYVKHTVEIKGGGGNMPPVDPPPVDPSPPDTAKWAKLIDVSKTGADKLNDAPTRVRMKASLAATLVAIQDKIEAGQSLTLYEAKLLVLNSIESVLLSRPRPSDKIDWSTWRKGNQAELDKLGLVDLADYISAVKAISAGL